MLLAVLACSVESEVSSTGRTSSEAEPIDPTTHDADHDGTPDAEDCRPYRADIHPDADEVCDGEDNDCDDKIDEGNYDLDDDGWNDARECWTLGGQLDCNDDDPDVHPGARETCDGVDEDCSGAADDADHDGDGVEICDDCNDEDAFVVPGAAEACDGIDNDCDGKADELWDFDDDGYSECMGDCDEDDPDRNPGAGDACDGIDNDCDDAVDEDFDKDLDGVPTCAGDCNDADAAIYAGAIEICDGKDNDCNAGTPETLDLDGDGYDICDGDCDDLTASANPANYESCDDIDNDCDGYVDELTSCYSCTASGDYLLCASSETWYAAESACEAFGATLAILTTSSENDEVAALVRVPTWIGANDTDTEDTFVWPTGAVLVWDSWASGEPDDSGDADCSITNLDGRRGDWGDEPCTSTYPFVCEF